jgi:heat shock protein HtpX
MAAFFGLVIAIGFVFAQYNNNPSILYIAVLFSIGMNIFSYWFSDKVVIKMTGAKPATKEQYYDLYTVTENLAITAGLPMPKLYVIADPVPNAFATGRNKDHSAVAVTTGLLEILERNELEGVVAHELAHIGNKDILISTVAVVLAGFIAILSDMFLRMSMFGGGDRDNKGNAIVLIIGIALSILAPIAATLMQLAISRKREFLADATGALLTRYPEGLARALEKIHAHNAPMRKASNATAHMYIANPFGPGKMKGISKLFMTHPPVEERLAALRGLSK